MAAPFASKDNTTLADFLQVLRLRKALIALIVSLVVLTTLAVTALLPRWYLATTKIRVEKPEGEVKLFQAQTSSYYDPYFLQDQLRTMRSEIIIYPVIENLQLNTRLAGMLGAKGKLTNAQSYLYLLAKMLRIDSQRSSSIIEIDVFAQDAALAASIANEVARVYSENRISFATSEQRKGLAQLRKELEAQEMEVSRQRDAVEKLREDLNISGIDLNARYSDMEIETLRQMQNSLIALSVDAIGRKTRWEIFQSIPIENRISLVNAELIQDPNIQNLLQAYLIADQTVSKLKDRLGENHPELISAVGNRAKIREQLDTQLSGYESSLEISYKEADSRVAELKRQLSQAKIDQILSARDRMRPFEESAQKLDDETRLMTTLKLTLRQREIDYQVPKRTIEILNIAESPTRPSRPSWPLNISFSLIFGLILGVGVSVLLEYFDTSFRTVTDIETKLNLPALGVIPFMHNPNGEEEIDQAEEEPFRVLHTNINMALKPGEPASLVLFSAGPGEGKSTTLHRLTRSMAAAGERVILIDSDLRRPTQHKLAHCSREPGLCEVLLGRKTMDEVVQRSIAPNLDFVPSGASAGFTLNLLYGNRLKEIITTLRLNYDKIIFDSPPIIGVSDASVLASEVDGTILLIQHRRNPQSMVVRAQQIIDSIKTPLLGVVLNQVQSGSGEDYGYYTHNYSYYSETPKQRRSSQTSAVKKTGDHLTLNESGPSDPPV
jgi:polysaccharide biosynthesis transport protein